MILIVADVTAPQAETYVRNALRFPQTYAAADCPIGVLAFGTNNHMDLRADIEDFAARYTRLNLSWRCYNLVLNLNVCLVV